jgi:hypothetical protein
LFQGAAVGGLLFCGHFRTEDSTGTTVYS